MFCSNCGEENNDDSHFCKKCGSPLEPINADEFLTEEDNVINHTNNTTRKRRDFNKPRTNQSVKTKNYKINQVLIAIIIIATTLTIPIIGHFIMGGYSIDENQLYNEKMTVMYNNMVDLDPKLNQLSNYKRYSDANIADLSNFCDDQISLCDNILNIFDNTTKMLTELNASITNDTRKEYIKLCIDEIKYSSEGVKSIKDTANIYLRFKNGELTDAEAYSEISYFDTEGKKVMRYAEDTGKEIKNYEKKHPGVLINGTRSPWYTFI